MPQIILTTLNARYFHASLGLRYLMANMGELESDTIIREFIIQTRPIDIVEALLQDNPRIVGFAVYIWNVEQTTQVVAMLKQVQPEITVVLGGPEVSYECDAQPVVALADYVITGPADIAFPRLCNNVLSDDKPLTKIIAAPPLQLQDIKLPYQYYCEEDIAHRIIYVEASRGCPFKCEFCLSALDKTAQPFDLDEFLGEMQQLYDRGARHFKFVDRTFNLKIDNSARILEFFLERMNDDLFLHFELIPDHLPERLKALVQQFPPGSLQFEVGIQSFNPEVQKRISRKQNNDISKDNLRWLRQQSNAHIHTDLIAGLPGEDLESFANGFDELVQLQPHEIQLGILKRLRGSPIIRHTETFQMTYNPNPPYNILCTSRIDFHTMQRLNRFARYWDLIANSGRFTQGIKVMLQDNAFHRFLTLSDWIYAQTHQTHQIALDRLFELVHRGMIDALDTDPRQTRAALLQDYLCNGSKKPPAFIPESEWTALIRQRKQNVNKTLKRQSRHLPA
jgi:radical SAM superfamily enzyme YgiQ (UPF0313 family)